MKKRYFFILNVLILSLVVLLGGCQCNKFRFSLDSLTKTKWVNKDNKKPRIKLKGPETMYIEQGNKFVEPGYYAVDNIDGDITKKVVVSGDVNYNMIGTYILTYYVKDNSGNWARTKTRKVEVIKPRFKM